jgi:hypothetical protein
MTNVEQLKWKAKKKTSKIIKKRLRHKHALPMKEFMRNGDVYENKTKKMVYHKTHVK